jgi:predicted ArsR family transcriptional regulator
MRTSRQRILEFLELKGIVSSQEIASAMHMTAANARHHIRVLVDDGVLVNAGQRLLPRRGRPEQVYQLAHQAEANNLDKLSATLLAKALLGLSDDERMEFLKELVQNIGEVPDQPKTMNLSLRLQKAMHILNEMHYQARWEARASNPRLILGHCPYAAILSRFPELCIMDKFLASHLIGAQVEQIAKLEEISPGLRHCIFQIKG